MNEDLRSKTYDVALSFAGEDRAYVRQVADFLRVQGIRVFYDEFEQVKLWGTDLTEALDRIYRKDSYFVVMFISLAYQRNVWTKLERRSSLAAALEAKREYVLPFRFDATELEGLPPTVAFLKNLHPGQLGELLLQKLAHFGIHARLPGVSEVPALRVWRISRKRLTGQLSAMELARFGGRWNSPGVPLVYTAGSVCNALIELLAHRPPVRSDFSQDWVKVSIRIPQEVSIKTIYSDSLPQGWRSRMNERLRAIGDAWAASGETCVLSLPSTTIPDDRAYLLNPLHEEFSQITIEETSPFEFDERLLGLG